MPRFQTLTLTILVLTLLSIGGAFVRDFGLPDSTWPLDKGERVTLSPGESLTQTFTARRGGLSKVEILFGKFTLKNSDRLTLELRDERCEDVLARRELQDESFDSEHTYAFVFDRVEGSVDETYCFRAGFESSREVAKDKAPRFFTDRVSAAEPYLLEGDVGTFPGTGPIAIRPGYRNASLLADLSELTDRISQYKPAFLKGGWLAAAAASGLVLTLLSAILLLRENRPSE